MKATPFEFRYRFWILLGIFVLGFVAPWDHWLDLDGAGPNTHVWGQLAILLSRAGMDISAAFKLVLATGIVLAFAGAALRTWASAYMRAEVVRGADLHTDVLVADGPYRYIRNPLYLGSWLNALALALLMPPSGAIFLLVTLMAFLLWLIWAEEKHMAAEQGAAYADYCTKVPRLVPALPPRVEASGARPAWGRAMLVEIFVWGVAVSFAALGWQYNAHLLIQCVLVSFGVSLVVRGVLLSGPEKA